ncbi:MAG: hypothetical protein GY816_03010 [Cytophagales bacterium]|nr:hypothetical protein [Cytophagales bacterium]
MGIPIPKDAHELCADIKSRMDWGENVLVHCKAGLGRTGTILACVLAEFGSKPELAIKEVRKNIRMAIQNVLQENFITHYATYINQKRNILINRFQLICFRIENCKA